MTEIQSTLERVGDITAQAPDLGNLAVDTVIDRDDTFIFGNEGIFSLEENFTPEDIASLVAVSKGILSVQDTAYGKEEADKIIQNAEQSIDDSGVPEFNLQVAVAVLSALRHDGVPTYDVLGNSEELARVSSSEQAFKQYISSKFLNSDWGSTASPAMYRLFLGKEAFDSAITHQAEHLPGTLLKDAPKLLKVSPESKEVIRKAFDTYVNNGKPFSLAAVSRELADIVGEDKIAKIIDGYLESPDAAYDYELSNFDRIVNEGLVEPDRVIETIIADINFSYNTIGLLNNLMSKRDDLKEKFIPKLHSGILSKVKEKDIDSGMLQNSVNAVLGFFSNEELFDVEFKEEFADVLIASQPAEKIKYLGTLKPYLSEDEFSEIRDGLYTKFHELPKDPELIGDEDLIDYIEGVLETLMEREMFQSLSEQQQIEIARNVFILLPHKMVDTTRYTSTNLPESVLTTMKTSLLKGVLSLDESSFVKDYEYILVKFKYTDQELSFLEQILIDKAQFVEAKTLLRNSFVIDAISGEGLLTIIDRAIDDASNESSGYFELSSIYKKLVHTKGYEFARDNFLKKLTNNPESIGYIVGENFNTLSGSDINIYLDNIVDNPISASKFLSTISEEVVFRLDEGILTKLCQQMIADESSSMYSKLRTLKTLETTLLRNLSGGFKNEFLKLNPIELLSEIKNIPPGMFEDARGEIISYLEKDPVAQLIPKYFAHVLRRLDSMPDDTSAIVLAKEASLAYKKAKAVYDNPDLKLVYERMYESAPSKKAKTELEAITYAKILGQIKYEKTTEISTISESQYVILESIYNKLGIIVDNNLDPTETINRVGDLYPFIVLGSSVVEGTEFSEYYRSIVQSALDGSFKDWKYRKESRELLIEHSMLPNITQEQYDTWSENTDTENRDILLNDAESVSRQIQGALRQHANLFSDIEEAMAYSVEQVHEKNKRALAEIGGKIKDVHIGKREGLLGDEQATKEIDKLQSDKDEVNFRINLVRLLNVTADEVRAGVLFNEKGNPTKTEIAQIIREVLSRAGDEGAEALQQVNQMIDSYNQSADSISDIIVSDTDDFGTTLAIGANPVGSCQHYETGQYRTALLSYFDTSTKVIVVKGQNDSFLSRSILRLAENNDGEAVLVLEPTYSAIGSDEVQSSIIKHAKEKADKMGLQLLVPDIGEVSVVDIPKIQIVKRMGTSAPYSYSDIFGGFRSQGEEKMKTSNVRKLKIVS